MLDPKWWVHVAKQLRVDSRIEVMSFDRSWFAELVVLEVGSGGFGGCRLAFILGPVALSNDREIPKPAVNEPRWGGPASKWQVVRVQDKKVLKDGFELKEEAAAWITERDKVAA
ncbi:MAG: hypothetical protein EOS26_03210 [Mesorhizobium sp.]|nr:MAG: hypothetical protein EOS26_03210 [Mesorhizobium sp.]